MVGYFDYYLLYSFLFKKIKSLNLFNMTQYAKRKELLIKASLKFEFCCPKIDKRVGLMLWSVSTCVC